MLGNVKDYQCSFCAESAPENPADAIGTLIVAPESIVLQWYDEFERHVRCGVLKMGMYHGVAYLRKKIRNRSQGWKECAKMFTAKYLASLDVVFCTYKTLTKDFAYLNLKVLKTRSRRKKNKYRHTPSPILKVKWWRIALDETQMVNTPTTTCAKTANEIEAVNRWCISGTPILTDFNDLFGLVYFLRIYPYYSKSWWHHLTIRPIESSGQSSYGGFDQNVLLRLLGDIFWRTEKKDLDEAELGVPPVKILSHELTFSDIEAYFYKHQKRACLREYQKKNMNAEHTDRRGMMNFMDPLLRLRQACCHPQIGSNGIGSSSMPSAAKRGHRLRDGSSTTDKRHMTLNQVLNRMIQGKRAECEDAQRSVIATRNGIAAILWIQEKYDEAESVYRDTLKIFETNSQMYQIGDKYQRIHVCRNLAELIEKHNPDAKDRDELLSTAKALESKYTNRFKLTFLHAKKSYLKMYAQNKSHLESKWWASVRGRYLSFNYSEYSLTLLECCDRTQVLGVLMRNERKKDDKKDDELSRMKSILMRRVEATISSFNAQHSTKWTFQDLRGLLLIIDREINALKEARENMKKVFEECIMKEPSEMDIYAKGNCFQCSGHMFTKAQRKQRRQNGTACQHCRAHKLGLEPLKAAVYAHIVFDDVEEDDDDQEKGRGKRKRRTIQEAAERRALKEGRGLRNSILVDVLSILSDVVINMKMNLGDKKETDTAKSWSNIAGSLKQEWNAGNLLHGKAGEQLMELDHLAQCRLRLRSNEDKTLSADRLAGSVYGIVIKGT